MEKNFPDGSVVTANYRDRESDHPWLIRALNETTEEATPFKTVIAENVSFKPTDKNSRERQLGCTMLASCKKAKGYDTQSSYDTKDMLRLAYCGDHFMDIATYKTITELDVLYLDKDGHMYGNLRKTVNTPVADNNEAGESKKKQEPVEA